MSYLISFHRISPILFLFILLCSNTSLNAIQPTLDTNFHVSNKTCVADKNSLLNSAGEGKERTIKLFWDRVETGFMHVVNSIRRKIARVKRKRNVNRLIRTISKAKTQESDSCATLVLRSGDPIDVTIIDMGENIIRVYQCPPKGKDVMYTYTKQEVLSLISMDGQVLYRYNAMESGRRDQKRETNSLAIISLIVGILSLLLFFIPTLGILGGLFSIIGGIVALSNISKKNQKGKGAAIFAIIFGAIGFISSISFLSALSAGGGEVAGLLLLALLAG